MDRSIRLWSLAKKRQAIEQPRAHEQAITGALWIAPGVLMTAGLDGCVRTWAVTPVE